MDENRQADELRRRQAYLDWKARKLPALDHLQRMMQSGELFRDVIRREQETRQVGDHLVLIYPASGACDEETYDVIVKAVYDDGSYDVDLTLLEYAPDLRKPGVATDWTVYRQELTRGVVLVEVLSRPEDHT